MTRLTARLAAQLRTATSEEIVKYVGRNGNSNIFYNPCTKSYLLGDDFTFLYCVDSDVKRLGGLFAYEAISSTERALLRHATEIKEVNTEVCIDLYPLSSLSTYKEKLSPESKYILVSKTCPGYVPLPENIYATLATAASRMLNHTTSLEFEVLQIGDLSLEFLNSLKFKECFTVSVL